MKLKLPSEIYSSQDVTALILEVQTYARWFAHSTIKQQVGVQPGTQAPALSNGATSLLRDINKEKQLSVAVLDELILSLKDIKETAKQMTITLAAPAPAELKKSLVEWCRNNLAPDILVNFRFSATLLGGMVVRIGSRVFDLSHQRYIMAARSNFPEVLRRV